MMKSSLAFASAGSPNSALPSYIAVVLATATRVGSEYVLVVPSAAVARSVATPDASAVITPSASTLAIEGVSDVQVKVVGTVVPLGSRSVAKIWSWKPTGRAGSPGVRPLKEMLFPTGGGGS